MTAFRHSAESVATLTAGPSRLEQRLSEVIAKHLSVTTNRTVSRAERNSWDRSLPILARDLVDAGRGQVEMLIEYPMPHGSKRADVVLAGVDGRTGGDAYVVVELKQWSQAEVYEEKDSLVLVKGLPYGPTLHPVLQVRQYCDYVADFVGALEDRRDAVRGVAYLHNAEDAAVHELFDRVEDERTRLFTKSRRGAWLDYLRDRFAREPGAAAADRLLRSAVRPSKHLLSVAAAEIKDREQFVLLAEQQLAYELVMHAVERVRRSDAKEVVLVTGGPGSGKSVIALSLLGELSRRGFRVLHATGSRSFTQTLRRHAGRGATHVQKLFTYFNGFVSAEPNLLDVLICDEAHRIRRTSANRFTRAADRTRRPQVDELMAAARVPVFLLDQHQVVKPNEIGTVEAIKSHAADKGYRVRHVCLDGQFRCGGSRAYEEWVLRLLGLDASAEGPQVWPGDDRFEVVLAESPWAMEGLLRAKLDKGLSARMSAGYCWPWSDPLSGGGLVDDVTIGDWAKPWNVKGDRAVGDAPPSALWATRAGGFEQVGCVYTAQGFEYDWSGVIIGPDLVARDGRLVTVREGSADPELKKRAVGDLKFDQLVRNVYKVLLTRGMAGTVIYATDLRTREFLAGLIENSGGASA